MLLALQQKLKQLESLDFSNKGESFVESRFLTPLLECLGYEAHKDYEVIRAGDDGSAFKLRYPPVEKGASRVKHYVPDYIPTVRKKMFWIIEAKSPKGVIDPFQEKYLVQGFQYCIHPEIQAKYLLISNGLLSAVYDTHGGVFLGQDIYKPIFEFRSSDLIERWPQIYDLLSVEKLRTRIEMSLKEMYDKLCLSSLDQNYPDDLIRRIGASKHENSREIEEHVHQLNAAEFMRRSQLAKSYKANLSAEQAFDLMNRPLSWNGCEGAIFVEKSLANGDTPEQIFARLAHDFIAQSIFRKLQTFAGVCILYGKIDDGPLRASMRKFLDEFKDANLPLLNQVECCCIRIVRKVLVISAYPAIQKHFVEALRSAPEFIRFVLPPTGFNESLEHEIKVHEAIFDQLRRFSEPELQKELQHLQELEDFLEPAFLEASKKSSLYRDTSFTWFQSYGEGSKHFAFKNILHNLGIE